MGGPASLRVRVLGSLDVEGVDERALGSRKARTLMKVLVLGRGAPVSADVIAEALWPGDDLPSRPTEQIGVLVSRMRAVLGAERLLRTDAGWSLAVDWLDIVELEARVDEAASRLAAGSAAAARVAARAALELVRGELLTDEPDAPWAETDRASVARLVARARLIAADSALLAGDAGDAAVVAEGLLDHDPYDEAALRTLMRACAAAGRPASALAAYARVRERLAEDLGVDPVRETEELHTAILLGPVAVPEPRRVPATGPSLVGRERELRALDEALAVVERGDTATVVVEGEAGIGKTALLRAWTATVEPRALVLFGRCDELGRGLPLQPVLDGLAAHLRRLGRNASAEVLRDVPTLAPMLAPFTPDAATVQPTTVTDPVAGQTRLFAELVAVIDRAAGDRPAVVVVEDMHLAVPSTIEWLRYAAHQARSLLVLASRRPDGPPSLADSMVLTLEALDLDAVVELVGRERAPDIYARSGGHPLFLVELVASTDDELPATVRDAVAARVDGLDGAATLRTAAVLGSEVDVDLLAAVLSESVSTLLEHIEAGVRARILEERGAELVFRHELVREALVADTNAARRALVHREAARALHDRGDHDPLQVAWHAQRGGDLEMATGALVDAARVAAGRHDIVLAQQLLDRAIELGDSVAARLARARIRIAGWNIDGARADATHALEAGAGADGLEVAAWVEYYSRDYERARRYAEEAAARTDHPGLRASCLAMTGRVLHASGDLPEADRRLAAAMGQAPNEVRGSAQVWQGALRLHQGRTDDAVDLVDRALAGREWLGHPFIVHHGHMFRTLALGQRGRAADALRANDEARAVARVAGPAGARFEYVTDNVRSWLLRGLGSLGEADELSAGVLELTTAEGTAATTEMRHAAMLDLVDGRWLAGDVPGAMSAIERAAAVETLHGTMAWHHRQRYWVQKARVALATGALDEASTFAARAVEDTMARGSRRYELFGRAVQTAIAMARREPFDRAAVDETLAGLEVCGGLEAWWVTAELAAAANDDAWWRDADRRAGSLVARAGDHAEAARRWVNRRFAALGRS